MAADNNVSETAAVVQCGKQLERDSCGGDNCCVAVDDAVQIINIDQRQTALCVASLPVE